METLFQEGCWDDTIKKSKEEEDREILTKNKNKTKKTERGDGKVATNYNDISSGRDAIDLL